MREKEHIRHRYAAIAGSAGLIFLLSGLVMLTPLVALLWHPEEFQQAWSFGLPALCQMLMGYGLWRRFGTAFGISLSIQEGGVVVLLSWITVILFSTWPFMSVLGLNFSQAVFESVSGWTTTGLSVVDVTQCGQMILLWRSIIQLAGGAGLAIIMMSAIIGPVGVGISIAEGRGDQLVPHVRQSARLVMVIYTSYAAAGTVAYWIAGMSPFDAFNHAFAAVSTGGFSTHPESIGYWHSAAIEAVTIALMLLGNLSFVTAWFLFRGHLRTVARNGELRLLALIIPMASAIVFLLTSRVIYPELGKSIRVALFETISAITTTGFSTVGYGNWNSIGVFLLVVLMLIGGGTCSTAGGIKQFRVYLLWKLFAWEMKRHLMPWTAIMARPVWEGDRRVFVDDDRARQVVVFLFLFLGIYAVGVMVLCANGYGIGDSLFEFASAISTVGLSVGVTTPQMPPIALWVETGAMFLGRLEFMVIFVSFAKLYKDGRRLLSGASRGA